MTTPDVVPNSNTTPGVVPAVVPAGVPGPNTTPGVVDVTALRQALERDVQGEIRFDAVSRALYSTDASVYQIEPLGVVVPRSRDDLLRVIRLCGQFRCPLTLRGGGTSQAGQAIGAGLIIDTSKHLIAILELNVERERLPRQDRACSRADARIAGHREPEGELARRDVPNLVGTVRMDGDRNRDRSPPDRVR